MAINIGILIFNKVEEMDFVGPWEVLSAAIEGHPVHNIQLIAPSLDVITCDKGMRVLPDIAMADVTNLDVLIVPGGTGARLHCDIPETRDWIAKIALDCTWVTSVCTGAFLLVASGVTQGRKMTTHHQFTEQLANLKDVEMVAHQRFVVDGNLVSAAGVTSGIEMSLWLVAQLFGKSSAAYVRDYIAYDTPPRDVFLTD